MTGMGYPAREGATRNAGAPESSHLVGRLLEGLIDQGGGEGRPESTAEEGTRPSATRGGRRAPPFALARAPSADHASVSHMAKTRGLGRRTTGVQPGEKASLYPRLTIRLPSSTLAELDA